jgi:Zn-finger nucleic acid-binding protein
MFALCVAASDGGAEVEIDRCGQCGALWFDSGELEMAANLHARPSAAESEHPCPVCRQQMRGAALPRGLFAHRCDSCHGTFLEADTVAALRSDKLPRLPDARPANPATVGFLCARCGQKFPYAKGNATSKGLMCPICVVNPQVEKITRGPTSTYRGSPYDRSGVDDDLGDALDSVLDLFRR